MRVCVARFWFDDWVASGGVVCLKKPGHTFLRSTPNTHTRTKTGANVRVVLRQQPGALHHDSQTGEGIAASMNPHDVHHHHHHHYHHQGGGALAYNTAEVIYSGEGGGR